MAIDDEVKLCSDKQIHFVQVASSASVGALAAKRKSFIVCRKGMDAVITIDRMTFPKLLYSFEEGACCLPTVRD